MKDTIDSDFEEILADGLAGTLEFTVKTILNAAIGISKNSPAFVRATVAETTLTEETLIGGIRPKRSFSATLRRKDLIYNAQLSNSKIPLLKTFSPKVGDIITYNGEEYRIRLISAEISHPLVRIEFSEK